MMDRASFAGEGVNARGNSCPQGWAVSWAQAQSKTSAVRWIGVNASFCTQTALKFVYKFSEFSLFFQKFPPKPTPTWPSCMGCTHTQSIVTTTNTELANSTPNYKRVSHAVMAKCSNPWNKHCA